MHHVGIFACILAATAAKDVPSVKFKVANGNRVETGGNYGCFGVNGVHPSRLTQVVSLTSGTALDFFTDYNCKRSSRVYLDSGAIKSPGALPASISGTDIKSVKLSTRNVPNSNEATDSFEVDGEEPVDGDEEFAEFDNADEEEAEDNNEARDSADDEDQNDIDDEDENNVVAPSTTKPYAQFKSVGGETVKLGGGFKCFSVNAARQSRLRKILKISAGAAIIFYGEDKCRRSSHIQTGSLGGWSETGTLPIAVSNVHIKSIRLVKSKIQQIHRQAVKYSCAKDAEYFFTTGSMTLKQCAAIACEPGQVREYVQIGLGQCYSLEKSAKQANGGNIPLDW